MRILPTPRVLRPDERALLDFMLSREFPGRDELRAQSKDVVVVGECECGCGTIDLRVPETSQPAKVLKRVPIQAANDECIVLVFVDNGMLSCLEIAYVDEPSKSIPPLTTLKFSGQSGAPG